jgi:lysophospholipase L1-like esterase
MKVNKFTLILISAFSVGILYALGKTPKKFNPLGKSAVFIGDSHTAGFGWGWQDSLAKKYGFKIQANLSKGGLRTDQLLPILEKYLASNPPKPHMLFIYAGANDNFSLVQNQKATENIQKMVDLGRKAGIQSVFVISGYRSSKVIWDLGRYGNYIQKSDLFKENLIKNIKNATVVPIWEDADFKMSTDSLHLIQSAQTKFADYIGSQIFKTLK